MTFEQTRLKTSAEGIEGRSPAQGEGVAGSASPAEVQGARVTRPHLAAAAGATAAKARFAA